MFSEKTKFWFGLILTVVVIVILVPFCGCKPKTTSRLATCLVCGDNGKNEGWFAYQMATGDIIEQEGIAMNVIFRKPCYFYYRSSSLVQVEIADGVQEIQSTGITGSGGRMTTKGKRHDWSAYQGRTLLSQAVVSASGIGGSYSFEYGTSAPCWEGCIAQTGCGIIDQYKRNASTVTTAENDAINNPTSNPPESGIEISAIALLQQQGGNGDGFPREMNGGFIAGNLTNPNHCLRYAAPFMWSFTFKTSSAEDLTGMSIPVRLSTDAQPHGVKVDATVIASSADKKTHIMRTDYFLPIRSDLSVEPEIAVYDRWTGFLEPNIWNPEQYDIQKKEDWLSCVDPNLYADPNVCPDPNVLFDPDDPNFFNFTSRLDTSVDNFEEILIPERIILIKTISINAENDYIYIDIDWSDPRMILLVSEKWLSNFSPFDLNGDGVVNLKDWKNDL